jgi:hypothetical protein
VAVAPVVQDDAGAGVGFIVTSPSETPPAVALNPEATIERAID